MSSQGITICVMDAIHNAKAVPILPDVTIYQEGIGFVKLKKKLVFNTS